MCNQYLFEQQFWNYMTKNIPKDKLPYYTLAEKFSCDWNIIGGEYTRWFFDPTYSNSLNNQYKLYGNIKYDYPELLDNVSPIPVDIQIKVKQWLIWTTKRVFSFKSLSNLDTNTSNVLLRISVSKLRKLGLSQDVDNNIFSNLIETYRIRKKVYTDYYFTHILALPF